MNAPRSMSHSERLSKSIVALSTGRLFSGGVGLIYRSSRPWCWPVYPRQVCAATAPTSSPTPRSLQQAQGLHVRLEDRVALGPLVGILPAQLHDLLEGGH